MISLANSLTNATSKKWHLWEIGSRFALNSTPGWPTTAATRKKLDTPVPSQPRMDASAPGATEQVHLAECVYSSVLESRLPHKIVDLLFTITIQNVKLTVL